MTVKDPVLVKDTMFMSEPKIFCLVTAMNI